MLQRLHLAVGEFLPDFEKFVQTLKDAYVPDHIIENHVRYTHEYNNIEGLSKSKRCKHYSDFFIRWQKFNAIYMEEWEQKGILKAGDITDKSISKMKLDLPKFYKEYEFFKEKKMFDGVTRRWNIIIAVEFWSSLKKHKVPILEFITYYYQYLIKGYFLAQKNEITNFFGCKEFYIFYGKKQDGFSYPEILSGVYLEKLPVYINTEGEVIDSYKHRQVLKIYRFSNEYLSGKYNKALLKLRMMTKKCPIRGVPFDTRSVSINYITVDLESSEMYIFTLNSGRGAKIYKPTRGDIEYMNKGNIVYVPIDVRARTAEAFDHSYSVSNDAKSVMDSKENQRMVLNFFQNLEEYGLLENKNVTEGDIKKRMQEIKKRQLIERTLEKLFILGQFLEMQPKFPEKDFTEKIHLITISICTDVLKFEWLSELLVNLQKEEKSDGIHIFEQLNMFRAIEYVFSNKGTKLYKVMSAIRTLKKNTVTWGRLLDLVGKIMDEVTEFENIEQLQYDYNFKIKVRIAETSKNIVADHTTETFQNAVEFLEQILESLEHNKKIRVLFSKVTYDLLMTWRIEVDQYRLEEFKILREENKEIKDTLSMVDFNTLLLSKRFSYLIEGSGIRFSDNQKKMLISDMNTLVLGRSGTGKTTISAFKILALDLLFMAYKKKFIYKKNSFKLTLHDLQTLTGCHTVFVTASPVLTNEVRKFYSDVISSIKKVLKFRENSAKVKEERLKKDEEEKKNITEGEDEEEKIDTGKPHEEEEIYNPFEEPELVTTNDKAIDQKTEKLTEALVTTLEASKEDILEDLELEKQMTNYTRLQNVPKSEFPLFLTVKKLVYMLDGDCSYSFFSRDLTGKIYGMDATNQWHNESKEGALMINRYQRDTYDFDQKLKTIGKEMVAAEDLSEEQKIKLLRSQGFEIDEEELRKVDDLVVEEDYANEEIETIHNMEQFLQNQQKFAQAAKMTLETQMFSQEVDFEMFEKKFWGKNKGNLKLSAMNVWTEIYSVIKSSGCTLNILRNYYGSQILTQKMYMQTKSSMNYISEDEKRKIYLIYIRYEKWKTKHNYYDFMDVVRHVFRFYPYWKTAGSHEIEYLVIDEVQDLAPLTIKLLLMVTKRNVFFCGDTAQTIAKGVSFRFHDLKDVFGYRNVSPKVVQLTKNYRSHQKILDLANSIVDIIELHFPNTIDKLQRESSDIDGPRPIILEGYDHESLKGMLMNVSKSEVPKFGCNQVVIVRNQQTKNNLPLFFQNALCLTVYEAKGLEFDDVILYNFFEDSPCDKLWYLIEKIEVRQGKRRKVRIEDKMTLDELDLQEYNKMINRLEQEVAKNTSKEDFEYVNILKSVHTREDVDRNFSALCSDLKYLYVSVTRPKNRLIIYDSGEKTKLPMYEYWESLGLVDICRKGEEVDHPILAKAFETNENTAESQEQWRALGIKLFRKKFYDSVIKCFEKSGDLDLKIRTLGFMNAEEGNMLLSEAETLLYAVRNNKALTRAEKKEKKNEGKRLKQEAMEKFEIAGKYFERIDVFQRAAQ